MRGLKRVLVALMLSAIPGSAWAQATLAGVVKDTSGAVLPGVTVEATSDVLIEKVRTSATDSTGRYQILDLRPGNYTVTFTLTGFATVKRDAVQLAGQVVTTVDADMRVGNVSETITVSGEVPVVDLQTTTRQRVIDQQVISNVPTSRNSFSLGVLIPGVSLVSGAGNSQQDVGGALGPTTLALAAHGGRTEDQRMMVNGVMLSTMIGGGWGGGAIPNASGISEIAFNVSAVGAETATGGVQINFIPRDGGNRFSGTVAGSFANQSMQGDSTVQVRNFSPVRASTVKQNGEINPGFGGPLAKDKLWFYLSGRYQKADLFVPGIFHDVNANDPTNFNHTPDTARGEAVAPRSWQVYQGRLTWQAAAKHKIGFTYDQESNCFCPTNVGAGAFSNNTPEASDDQRFPLQRFVQVDWSTPVSSKLLIEASAIHRVERWGGMHLQTGGDGLAPTNPDVIGVASDTNPAFYWRAAPGGGGGPAFNNSWNVNFHYRAAVSYISGGHNLKVGFNNAWGHHENTPYDINPYSFIFTGNVFGPNGSITAGTPSQIREFATPYTTQVDVNADLGLFLQDKWTVSRWTLTGAIRYDWFKSSFPEQTIGPGPLVPNRPVTTFPEQTNINWKDITPRVGVAYDLFGNGKTALKASINKYLTGLGTFSFAPANEITSAPNPILSLVNTSTRIWNDNGDRIPQCDLTNTSANGECGALPPNFGSVAAPSTTWDPKLMTGWNNRQYNWEFSVGVQHEIRPRVSVEVSYFRRWYGNFYVADNTAYSAADFDVVNITAPTDPDLPNSGQTITGVYNLKPAVALFGGKVDHWFYTKADNYGTRTEHWNGVDVAVNARMTSGLVMQGGVSTGRATLNNCGLANNPQLAEMNAGDTRGVFGPLWFATANPLQFCDNNNPGAAQPAGAFITQVKALAAYTIPKADVILSGTFQSLPGPQLSANYNAIGPGLGFLPFPGLNFKTVQIVPAGYNGDRLNQLDFRIGKLFKAGTTRTSINFDIYNLLNSDAVLTENAAFAVWRQPTGVLQARFFKISAQFDF